MSQVGSCLFVFQGRDMQESIKTLSLLTGPGARDQLLFCSREFELGSKWLSGPPSPRGRDLQAATEVICWAARCSA